VREKLEVVQEYGGMWIGEKAYSGRATLQKEGDVGKGEGRTKEEREEMKKAGETARRRRKNPEHEWAERLKEMI